MLVSKLCNEQDFKTEWFKNCCVKLQEPFKYHRKLWEYCFIYESLLERGYLQPGKKGLGFAVGKEPLTAAFASHGCRITSTDLELEKAQAQGWTLSNQHCNSILDLNKRGICDPYLFNSLVTFKYMDMNKIDNETFNVYDFTWSSCAFEHCGSIDLGKKFIINQMNCLKPGGIAIHTTEYNLSSNKNTIETGPTVLFRKQDIEWIVDNLRALGHSINIDYTVGKGEIESIVAKQTDTDYHLRLHLDGYITTSIGLIITKSSK
ncbi:MAG: hypothetical protein JG781_2379 [Peptococcaceae bacterium]|jgi:hypothetical protein|nr:hypothetical protein [Peptococcaceae bacterium]